MQQFDVQNTFQMETRITKKNSKQPPLHNISIHSGRRRIRRRKLLPPHPKAQTKKLQCIFLLKPLHLYRYFIWTRLRCFSMINIQIPLALISIIFNFHFSYFQPHRKTSTGAKKQEQLAQFPVAHNPRIQEVLKPQSASAPNSPRLSHRALPITVTSSATVKVASPSPTTNTSQNKSRKPHEDKLKAEPITRKRSKSPVPRR